MDLDRVDAVRSLRMTVEAKGEREIGGNELLIITFYNRPGFWRCALLSVYCGSVLRVCF